MACHSVDDAHDVQEIWEMSLGPQATALIRN